MKMQLLNGRGWKVAIKMGVCTGGGGTWEGMRRGSVSPAWWGAVVGAAASVLLQRAPPGVGVEWGRAGWHPGPALGRSRGGWGWSCDWRVGDAAG